MTPKLQVLVTVGGGRTSLKDVDYAISLLKSQVEKTKDWCSPEKTTRTQEDIAALIAIREDLKSRFWQ